MQAKSVAFFTYSWDSARCYTEVYSDVRERVISAVARKLRSITPQPVLTQSLLLSVVEYLKLPLTQIARRAELEADNKQASLSDIRLTADAATQLLDNYILGVQLATQEATLNDTEPVAISSVLYKAEQRLRPIAKAYGVELEMKLDGKYGPVMTHRRGLEAALTSLGYALIEALPAQEAPQLKLQLSAHRCRYGIVAGLYCDVEQVTTEALRTGRQLYGHARQPLNTVSHTSGAGIFVADAILHAMQSQLTTSRHRNLYGLGVVLPLNPQLSLV